MINFSFCSFSNLDIVCKKLILSLHICDHNYKGHESENTFLSNVKLVDVKFCQDHRDKIGSFPAIREQFFFDSHPHKMLLQFPKFNKIHLLYKWLCN